MCIGAGDVSTANCHTPLNTCDNDKKNPCTTANILASKLFVLLSICDSYNYIIVLLTTALYLFIHEYCLLQRLNKVSLICNPCADDK